MDLITLAAAKGYVGETADSLGVVKGAPATIKSITEIDGGHRVTFEWTGTSGTKQSSTLDVMNGVNGQDGYSPTISITDITGGHKVTVTNESGSNSFNVMNGKAFTYDDFTVEQLENLKGTDGISPTVTITEATGRHTVSFTDKDGVKSFVVKDGSALDTENYYTKDEVDAALIGKANADAIPTVPVNVSELNNDENYIKNTVDNLVHYYNKADTYTKTEVNGLISNIQKLTSQIADQLPTENIDPSVIYLIKIGDTSAYMQHMYINGAWAELGSTQVDLSDYYKKTEIDTKLAEQADKTELPTVPTLISAFTNDKGYMTEFTETDPTVPAWAKAENKPSYTAAEVHALPDDTEIPIFTNKTVLDGITAEKVTNWDETVSPTITENENNTDKIYKLDVTTVDGTFTTPNLKGKDGTDGSTVEIDSSNKHWLIDGVDTNIIAEGADGHSPVIGENGHWFIGDIDTGVSAKGKSAYEIAVSKGYEGDESTWIESLKGKDGTNGKDGKSIQSITKDDNNNIIVTFTDNSTQNIGRLSIDISADFLTESGFGNIRYYQGKFQYYDKDKTSWVDLVFTGDNQYIINMIPSSMKSVGTMLDTKNKTIKLKMTPPSNTIINGQLACIVDGVKIIRKVNSAPTGVDDPDAQLVVDIKSIDFDNYTDKWFADTLGNFVEGKTYYYHFYPYSDLGFYNTSSTSITKQEYRSYNVFEFTLNQSESDPSNMITYGMDNKDFIPSHMHYTSDKFDYGDWTIENGVWFIQKLKPVMLKYDGSVAYELNKDDFTKKKDGSDSDISNDNFEGNAMIGIPKVYWKIVDNEDNTCNVYFSDKKVDEDFHCYSHIDNNGNEIDYCYMPIYNGSKDSNNKLRSLSDKTPMISQTGETEIAYAKANNLTSDEIWNTELYSDRILITLLLLLIGKSTDTQTVFGRGNENGSFLNTGTMNKNGLFYGSKSSSQGVKVFGIENFWGNLLRRTAGYIYNNSMQKVKMTYGKQDGSTCIGYNITGDGYVEIPNSQINGSNGGYIKTMVYNKMGIFPKIISGSSSTYYTDGCWFGNNTYGLFGGFYSSGASVGALCVGLYNSVSVAYETINCTVSCKPLA